MECWRVTKDIQDFYHARENMDEDQQMNYLLGLETMYEVKFEKLWNTFEQCVQTKQV